MKEGWEYKKLGEIGTIVTGSTPSTKKAEYYDSSDFCFVKPSDLPANGFTVLQESEYHLSSKGFDVSRKLPKGSVLVSCIGIIGKTAILDMEATCNQQINAILPNGNTMPRFLAYSVLSQRHRIESIANAPVVPLINKTEFSKITIPLPPLSEQQSIVAELDKINEIIDLKKAQLKDLDLLAQSIFYDMFGDPIENPKGWEVKKLGDVCDIITKGTTPTTIGFEFTESGISFVKVESFNADSSIDVSKLAHISLECYNAMARSQLKAKDIMICIAGATVGKIAIVDDSILPANTNQACAIVRLAKDSMIEHKYVLNYLKQYIKLVVHNLKKGAAQPNLSLGQIRDTKICIPPISLQQSFASKIQAIESQKSAIKQSLADVETLLASRMDYYFN